MLAATLGVVAGAPLPGFTSAAPRPGEAMRAGAAAVKITPSLARTVYIAGYGINRTAESVRDDLWARAVVLEAGGTRLAVVSCDLIGLTNYRVRRMRERVRSVPGEHVLITTTHVHSGPDTLGLWGKTSVSTGLDPEYMTQLEDLVAGVVDQAAAGLQPVQVRAGRAVVPDGLVYNSREPVQDRDLTVLQLTPSGEVGAGRALATFIHYGAHPEVNKSRALTSDFVHLVREAVEAKYGGIALYLNGALGGMVTPQVKEHSFAEMERVGRGVGEAALGALAAARRVESTPLRVAARAVRLPLENERFKFALGLKLLDAGDVSLQEGELRTEVWRVDLGPLCWVTIPGEVLPAPALALRQRMPGPLPLVVSMANDELGYILDPADYDRPLYRYERSMSVGKETWPRLLAAAEELLR